MSRPSTLVVLLLGLVSATHGHIGGKSFAVYELPDEGLEEVDLHDGSIGEWEALLGAPSLRARPDWVDSAGHWSARRPACSPLLGPSGRGAGGRR